MQDPCCDFDPIQVQVTLEVPVEQSYHRASKGKESARRGGEAGTFGGYS